MKKKLKNYLKIGVLLFGVSILLFNCEKENINETSKPQSFVEEIKQDFNKEDFTKSIPYEFDVNWDLIKKDYSEELKTDYYEFPIRYSSSFTPHINDLKKTKGNYFKSYKIIATFKNENINFYALRVYEKISETGQIISEVNFNYSSNFNGLIHLVDNENAIVFAKKIEKGIESIKDYYAKDLKELDPIKSREVYSCATVVTDHYKDWYKKWTDDNGTTHKEYKSTQYLGRSSEIICAYQYLPDYDTTTSTAGGGSPGAGAGTYKKNCDSTPNSKNKYFSRASEGCAVIVTEDTDECPKGKVYNSDLDVCECPEGKFEDSNGNCVIDCTEFDEVIKNVLNMEGGFVNDPADPGGATNKGISWRIWNKYSNSILGISPTIQNLQSLNDNQAKKIYKAIFWNSINAGDINDGDLRYLIFDFHVNAGTNAIKVLQKTLNQLGSNINVDGNIGTQTLQAINDYSNQVNLYNTFKTNRISYYNRITQSSINRFKVKNPNTTQTQINSRTFQKFINGWLNRANHFKNKTSTNNYNVNC